jgi:glycosyltransferase involved in cell wall biosynthesis
VRIAFAYRNLNRSGSLERDSIQLVERLVRRGLEMHCYCDPALSEEIPGVIQHPVVPATRSRSRIGYPLLRLSFAARATRALRRDRSAYDLVHVLGVSAWEHDVVHVPAVMTAEQRRWPEEAGADYRGARLRAFLSPAVRPEVAAVRALESLQFRRGRYHRVTCVTAKVREDLVRVHGVAPEVIDVIPPAIEVARFGEASDGKLRTSLGLPAGSEIVLFVGHAFERKGLGDAIAALAATRQAAHLVVVGNGPREEFEREAAAVGVADRIHFRGGTTEPEAYYASADLVVLPTRHDPWGIPIVEAMAAGVPVITTAAAGSAAAAHAAGAAVLVPPRSPRSLADAISSLLADPDRRREMGERGRKEAARFDVDPLTDATIETYERALAAKRKGR